MIEQVGNAVTFYFHFTESKLAKTGLTVTCNVRRKGSGAALVNSGACTEWFDGLYYYTLSSGSVTVEDDYAAVAYTATTSVDQRQIPALWTVGHAGLDNLDATISSRNATAPDNAGIAAVKAKTDNLPLSPAAVGSAMTLADGALLPSSLGAGTVAAIQNGLFPSAGYTAPDNTSVAAIKAKTDNLPTSPAAVGSAMTLTSGERIAIANEVEAQIIDETDSEKVLLAITDKIASVNPSLGDLTLAAIASAVWANGTRTLTTLGALAPSNFASLSINVSGHISRVTLTDLLTGHTPQTGDAFARIGAAGAGLTALGDARLANLDAAMTSRMATFTLPSNFAAMLITAGGAVTAGTVSDKTGYALTPDERTAIAAALERIGGTLALMSAEVAKVPRVGFNSKWSNLANDATSDTIAITVP